MTTKYAALVTRTDGNGDDVGQEFQFYKIRFPMAKGKALVDEEAEQVILEYLARKNAKVDWREAELVEVVVAEGSRAYEQLAAPEKGWVCLEAEDYLGEVES